MRRKPKISPGQLSIFEQIIYAGKNYKSLKEAMISAMQDFYIRKIFPPKIFTVNNVYDLKAMKKFWRLHGFHDLYIC